MNPPALQLPRLPIFNRTGGGNFNCGACRHYAAAEPTPDDLRGPRQGMCMRFPPTAALGGMQNMPNGPVPLVVPIRPPVLESGYCGEFSKRPGAEN